MHAQSVMGFTFKNAHGAMLLVNRMPMMEILLADAAVLGIALLAILHVRERIAEPPLNTSLKH
jgi:hypothetical protein